MLNGKLDELFELQKQYQYNIVDFKLPADSVKWFQYHMLAMNEELGEVLKADKRWKTHRNIAYDKTNKLEELSDVFITLLNLSMYSGFSSEELFNAVANKIDENTIKLIGGK